MSNGQLPHSLDIVSDYFPKIEPPEGDFDPNGSWEHRYVMWIALRGRFGDSWPGGALRLIRRPSDGGEIELGLTQVTNVRGPTRTEVVRASMTCASDRLSSPRSWRIASEVLDQQGRTVEHTPTEVTGSVHGRMITQRRGKDRTTKFSRPLSSNWSLFDAVQRLPFGASPITFDMLEDLELLKPKQRLSRGRAVQVELGGRRVRLHSFEQIGDGILPYTYLLDDQHRLLIAVGGLRTFIFDPEAAVPEVER